MTGRDTDDTVRAWCSALSREHILWDFVLDRQLSRAGLTQYRVLIVPGTPHLPAGDLATIEGYVRGGGSALFVGEATRFGSDGQPLPDFAAAALLGVRHAAAHEGTGRPPTGGYLRIAELPLADLAGELVPIGAFVPLEATSAQVMAEAIPGGREPLSLPPTDGQTWPGITWRMVGGGRVVHVASGLETVLPGRGGPLFTAAERLVGQLVRWLGGERVRVKAPRNLWVQLYRAPGGATVHLVNRPPASAHLHEVATPCGEVEILIPQTLYASNVRALDGSEVEWDQAGRRLRIVVRDVLEYRCLRIEGALG